MTSPEDGSDGVKHVDSSEEDTGCYFLQPASCPYNIAEKVQQANMDLFSTTPHTVRSAKVKFRDELVSFEPDLTDDDVNSIESDQVDELPEELSANNEVNNNPVTYTTILREGLEVEGDMEEEAVVEELILSDEEVARKSIEPTITKPSDSSKKPQSARPKKRHRTVLPKHQEVHCKEHCIEKIEADLSMCVRKLDIHEKPNRFNLPPLQLHQRKCCDDIKLANSDRNLPHYNGYRSEYGLTSRQIKTRNRYTEMIRQKEMARQKLIEEYRALKMRQNEAVFCQWLREVSKRKEKRGFEVGSKTERPKTAGFVPKMLRKQRVKRPTTTQSCVYIELSPNMLNRGVHVGDLLVTNSKELSKKLHILTVS